MGMLRHMVRYRDRPWFPNDTASSAGVKPALLGVSRLAPAFTQHKSRNGTNAHNNFVVSSAVNLK